MMQYKGFRCSRIQSQGYRCIPIRRQGVPIDLFYMMMRIQETIYSEIIKGDIMEKRPILIKKNMLGGDLLIIIICILSICSFLVSHFFAIPAVVCLFVSFGNKHPLRIVAAIVFLTCLFLSGIILASGRYFIA